MKKPIDFSKWISRSHNLGDIIPKEKGRGGHLTAIREIWIKERYGLESRISSKYLDKGIACESEGVEMLKKVFYPNDYVSKNREEFIGEYTKGTPDVIMKSDDCVSDIKNAWDAYTFENAECSHSYLWQLNNYALLTGRKKCRLFYCLNSMPDFMVSELEMKEFYAGRYGTQENPEFLKVCQKIRAENNYDHIPIYERFKFWEWSPTKDDFEKIKDSVIFSRNEMVRLESEKQTKNTVNKALMGIN